MRGGRRTTCRPGAVLLALAFPLVSPAPVSAQDDQSPDVETTRIAEGVYQFRYETHNSFFVVTGEGVLAFDPISPEAARHYASAIRAVAPDAPLRVLVYSHHHADHASGAPVLFRELGGPAPIVAHENAVEPIVEREDMYLPPPDITFSRRASIRAGQRTLELRYLGKSHGDDLVVGYLPEEGIVFAVDFVTNDGVGYRDLPGWHFPDFLRAMERLQELEYDTVVFGHGPPGGPPAVDRQLRYYRDLREAVSRSLDRGLSRSEAVEQVRLPEYRDWRGYEDWFPLNVKKMYTWLAEERPSSTPK